MTMDCNWIRPDAGLRAVARDPRHPCVKCELCAVQDAVFTAVAERTCLFLCEECLDDWRMMRRKRELYL